jgi:hypothetical protein
VAEKSNPDMGVIIAGAGAALIVFGALAVFLGFCVD